MQITHSLLDFKYHRPVHLGGHAVCHYIYGAFDIIPSIFDHRAISFIQPLEKETTTFLNISQHHLPRVCTSCVYI